MYKRLNNVGKKLSTVLNDNKEESVDELLNNLSNKEETKGNEK